MKNKYLTFLLPLIIFSGSCRVKSYNASFIEQFNDENFDTFKNVCMHIRGHDSNGNLIIFARYLTDTANGPYIVIIDGKENKIKETSVKLIKDADTGFIDKEALNILALKFIKYDINYLKVDYNNNIFISVVYDDRGPTLIRFSNLVFKTKQYRNWRRIKGFWYEKR